MFLRAWGVEKHSLLLSYCFELKPAATGNAQRHFLFEVSWVEIRSRQRSPFPTAKRGEPVAVHTRLPFSQGRVGLGAAVVLHLAAAADLAYYQRHKGVVWLQRRPNEALRHAFFAFIAT